MRHNIDRLAQVLSFADVRAVSDAAIAPRVTPEFIQGEAALNQERYAMWQPRLDASCMAATMASETSWQCLAGLYLVQNDHLDTPTFFIQDQRDPKNIDPLNGDQERARRLAEVLRTTFASAPGAFIPREGIHIYLNGNRFNRVEIEGHTLAETLGNWYFARGGPTTLIDQP